MAISGAHVGFKRRIYTSQAKESTFGTAQTLAYVFDPLPGAAMIRRTRAMALDSELSKGSEDFPEYQYHLEMATAGSVRTWASPEAIGLFGAFALGGDSVSGTTHQLHTITSVAGGVFPGSLTVEEHSDGSTADASSDLKYLGCYVRRFKFSWSGSGMAMVEVDLGGTGKTSAAATQTEGSLSTASVYFPCASVGCWVKAAATKGTSPWTGSWSSPTTTGGFNTYATYVDLSHHITGGSFEWVNEFSTEHPAGTSTSTGIFGQQPVPLKRTATVELTAIRDTTSKALIHAMGTSTDAAPAEYAVIIECTSTVQTDSSNHSAAFILPLAALGNIPTGDDGEVASDTVQFITKKTYAGTSYGPARIYVGGDEGSVYNQ